MLLLVKYSELLGFDLFGVILLFGTTDGSEFNEVVATFLLTIVEDDVALLIGVGVGCFSKGALTFADWDGELWGWEGLDIAAGSIITELEAIGIDKGAASTGDASVFIADCLV